MSDDEFRRWTAWQQLVALVLLAAGAWVLAGFAWALAAVGAALWFDGALTSAVLIWRRP